MYSVDVALPVPFMRRGAPCTTARVREVTGHDELFLAEDGSRLLPAQRTTALLARCVTRLGCSGSVNCRAVRALTVGNRQALLLHLRRLTFGNRLSCFLDCPREGCGQPMDLDLDVEDMLVDPREILPEVREATLTDGDCDFRVLFRLPIGADEEEAAQEALRDIETAEELLLRRCIVELYTKGDRVRDTATIPPCVMEQLPRLLAELDPQAQIELSLTCPECGFTFETPFDIAGFFHAELAGKPIDYYSEVHALASHYHWTEPEISALPRRRRHIFLNMLFGSASAGAAG